MTLAGLTLARIARPRRARLTIVLWTLVGLASAIRLRQTGSQTGADHVLKGVFAVVVLPLLAYGIVSAALGGTGLRPSLRGAIALGAAPGRAARDAIGVTMVVAGVLAAIVGALLCAVAHGRADAPLAIDLVTTAGTAFLGGAAYAAYFCAGSAIGRGAFRGVFLVLDWVLGIPAGFGSLFTPRAHVVSLLGGAPSFDLSRRGSCVVLALLLVGYATVALRLGERTR